MSSSEQQDGERTPSQGSNLDSQASYLDSQGSDDEDGPQSPLIDGNVAGLLDDDEEVEDEAPMGLNPLAVFGKSPSRTICRCQA